MDTFKGKIYIVEDEAIPRAFLEELLEQSGYEIAGSSAKAEKAFNEIPNSGAHLVLVDINLNAKVDGIGLVKQLAETGCDIPVIYLTAYSDAETLDRVKGTHPAGYIKKPFDNTTLLMSIQIAIQNEALQKESNEPETLFIKDGYKREKVIINDIIYLKSDGNYLRIVLENVTYFIRAKLSDFLEKLPAEQFVQVHRSIAINAKKVNAINKDILMLGDNEFKVSVSFEENVKKVLPDFKN